MQNGNGLLKYKELIYFLVHKELRIRYRNSLFGFLWSLLEPLGLMIIYTIVFSYIVRFEVENYSLHVLAGLIPWTFFAGSLSNGSKSLTRNASLVKKVYFPRQIFPITTVTANLFNFIPALALVFVYALILQSDIAWERLLLLPAIIILQFVFVVGLAVMLSAANVFYKDVELILTVVLRGWMYLSPIIYPLSMVPEKYMNIYLLNPMAVIISLYRWVFYSSAPAPLLFVVYTIVITIIVTAVSWIAFKKMNRRVGEVI